MKLNEILGRPSRDLSKLSEIEKRDIAMQGIEVLVAYKKSLDKKEFDGRFNKFGKGLKLNLGCGNRKMEGFINIDKRENVNPDILWDLENGLPKEIKDDSVTGVFASNLLEHIINFIPLMENIYRACKNNARVEVIVPHYKSHQAFSDPTHVRYFTEHTFNYFSQVVIEKNLSSFDYNFKCDFENKYINISPDGLMRVVLKVKKEEKHADRKHRNKKA